MNEILLQTYTIALPIVLGYIVWLLKQQKKSKDANTKGTMLLLRVKIIEYHDKYMELGRYHHTLLIILLRCMIHITHLVGMAWLPKCITRYRKYI